MNFSMFSCSRFFLWNRKQSAHSAMSKRRQEGSAGDSSPITNHRSVNLVISKPGSISLVPRNMSSYFSSRDMSDSESLEHVEVEPDSVRTRMWKHIPNTSPYPTEHSQEWKPEPTQQSSWKQEQRSEGERTWKQKQHRVSSHSTCCWKTECSHVQIRKRIWYGAEPDASLHGKSFIESEEEVGNHGRIISQRIGANSDEHIQTGIIHARFNAGSHPSWTK